LIGVIPSMGTSSAVQLNLVNHRRMNHKIKW
jgi:hypothetical protein